MVNQGHDDVAQNRHQQDPTQQAMIGPGRGHHPFDALAPALHDGQAKNLIGAARAILAQKRQGRHANIRP